MTIGIYVLKFTNTEKVYVGKSINIENRFKGHRSILKHGKGVKKLQEAYNTYGIPTLYIHLTCEVADLNAMEELSVNTYNSLNNGFNTLPGGDQSNCYGVYNHQSKYSEDDYYNVLCLLGTPGISWNTIMDVTGVSRYVIAHISALESHGWMEEAFPIEYNKLKEIHDSVGRMSAFMQGIVYPKIVSPSGEVFEVQHQTNFAKEHGLLQPKLHEVLQGNRNIHKGWHLETYIDKPDYPKVVSPLGVTYTIKFGQSAEFCREQGLIKSNFHSLLKGKSKSCKGWKLAQA